ncbi:hypothetical protein S83_023465 [Arachis hypogaea]
MPPLPPKLLQEAHNSNHLLYQHYGFRSGGSVAMIAAAVSAAIAAAVFAIIAAVVSAVENFLIEPLFQIYFLLRVVAGICLDFFCFWD